MVGNVVANATQALQEQTQAAQAREDQIVREASGVLSVTQADLHKASATLTETQAQAESFRLAATHEHHQKTPQLQTEVDTLKRQAEQLIANAKAQNDATAERFQQQMKDMVSEMNRDRRTNHSIFQQRAQWCTTNSLS